MSSLIRVPSLYGLCSILVLGVLAGCVTSSPDPVVGADVEKRVYLVRGSNVDEPPEIIGGYAEVDRLKKYPKSAEEDDAYGVIWIQSTISASGATTRLQVVDGGHPALETEARRVIQELDFRPARKNDGTVQSIIQIPVIFQGPYARPEENQKRK